MTIQELHLRAVDVLGTEEKAVHWMNTPNWALGGVSPSSLTGEEITLAMDILGRIEFGVYS